MDARLARGVGRFAHLALRMLACLAIAAVLGSCAAPARHDTRAGSAPVVVRAPGISIPLGGEVDGLASGGAYLWAFVRDSGVLVRVDQRTGQARQFALTAWRGMPVVVAASASGVWLANQHSTRPDLIRVSPWTGRIVARPRLSGDFGPITGLAAAYGRLWVLVPDGAFPPGWRVISVDAATNRVGRISADTPGTQLTGHTAAMWASAGKLWITESLNVIVSLDPRTLVMRTTTTSQLSEGWVFGDGRAWELDSARARLEEIDPQTGRLVRTLATPSAAGNDYLVAGRDVLWVFRGSHVTELDPRTGRVIATASSYPLAAPLYTRAIVTSTGLWYLAQARTGIALDRILGGSAAPSARG